MACFNSHKGYAYFFSCWRLVMWAILTTRFIFFFICQHCMAVCFFEQFLYACLLNHFWTVYLKRSQCLTGSCLCLLVIDLFNDGVVALDWDFSYMNDGLIDHVCLLLWMHHVISRSTNCSSAVIVCFVVCEVNQGSLVMWIVLLTSNYSCWA
jgi:hypothetical protein